MLKMQIQPMSAYGYMFIDFRQEQLALFIFAQCAGHKRKET